jgi:beta-galactosidase
MELLKPEGAEVISSYEHRYWNTYAAVTRNAYGDGTAYYIGCFLEKQQLKAIYEKAAEDAGVHCDFAGEQWPLIVRSGQNSRGEEIHYVFNYSPESRQVVCPYEQAEDILNGNAYKKGDVITLSDWNLVIIK